MPLHLQRRRDSRIELISFGAISNQEDLTRCPSTQPRRFILSKRSASKDDIGLQETIFISRSGVHCFERRQELTILNKHKCLASNPRLGMDQGICVFQEEETIFSVSSDFLKSSRSVVSRSLRCDTRLQACGGHNPTIARRSMTQHACVYPMMHNK